MEKIGYRAYFRTKGDLGSVAPYVASTTDVNKQETVLTDESGNIVKTHKYTKKPELSDILAFLETVLEVDVMEFFRYAEALGAEPATGAIDLYMTEDVAETLRARYEGRVKLIKV